MYFIPLILIIIICRYYSNDRTIGWFDYIVSKNNLFIVKFMQWLSLKPEIIGNQLAELFDRLKKYHPIHHIDHTNKIIKKYPELQTISFDPNPIGSGTVAQVYRGYFNNQDVAIKILHPNLTKNIKIINYILNIFVRLICWYYSFNYKKVYNIINIDNFYYYYYNQINLSEEQRFVSLFQIENCSNIAIIPKVLYCQNDIIIYHYQPANNFYKLNLSEEDHYHYVKSIRQFIIENALNGVYHLDLHDENWGIFNNKLVVYDFGHCYYNNPDILNKLVMALLSQDFMNILLVILNPNQEKDINLKIIKQIEYDEELLNVEIIKINNLVYKLYQMCYLLNLSIDSHLIDIAKNEIIVTDMIDDYFHRVYDIKNYNSFQIKRIELLRKIIIDISNTSIHPKIKTVYFYYKHSEYFKKNYPKFQSILANYLLLNGYSPIRVIHILKINPMENVSDIYNFVSNTLDSDFAK